MFERYTEKARRVIFFARYEASMVGGQAIEAEHILLGILREDRILLHGLFSNAQTVADAIRMEIASRMISRDKLHASVDLPLSPGAKRVLSFAADESEKLHSGHIGTEHLMLGLIRDERSFANELLSARGVTAEKVIDFLNNKASVHNEEKFEAASPEDSRAAERLSQPIWLLVDMLARKGLLSREEFMGELLGKGASISILNAFNRLVELLVRKGIISDDEKREISTGQS
jgi:ATP-dependent Clp protease ATP-binding subunit ClpC